MSEPTNAVVCLVILVDSSLLVLSEWTEVLGNYVRSLIGRLSESLRPRAFRIGCVCYASASTRPTPLLSRTYFMGATELSTPLAKTPGKFGVGQTGTGAQGMAVLEGIVAAIELFDAFKDSTPSITMHCHIVHIAACNPDSAERPLWNTSPALDAVTWDTLPAELRKRNINYSLIALRASQKLTEFHSTVASGSTQNAWFETKPSHVVCLMGYPSAPKHPTPSQSSPAGHSSSNKRANEAGSSPENKRARIPSKASPKPKNSPTPKSLEPRHAGPSAQPTTPGEAGQSTAPAVPSNAAGPDPSLPIEPPNISAPQPQPLPQNKSVLSAEERHLQAVSKMFTQVKIRQVEERLQAKELEAQAAERVGDHAKAAELRRSRDTALEQFERLKSMFPHTSMQSETGSATKPGGSSQLPQSNPQASKGNNASSPKSTPAVPAGVPPPADQSHDRVLSQTQPPQPQASMMLSNAPPQLATQMQKLMDQHNRTPRMSAGVIPPSEQPTASGMQSVPPRHPPEWQGFLTWKGTDSGTGQRREMRTFVMIKFNPKFGNVTTATWPPMISLSPSTTTVPLVQSLQEWVSVHNGSVAIIQSARLGDQKTNEDNYKTLLRLLMDKNIFAIAAWPVDGQVKNHLVLFIHREQLCCAYFSDGVPELPRPPNAPPPPPPNALQVKMRELYIKLPPNQRVQIDAMPPLQREEALKALLATIIRRQQQQQQMMQAQQAAQAQAQASTTIPGSVSGQPVGPPAGMNVGNQFAGRPPAMFPNGQQGQSVPMSAAPSMMGFTPQMAMGGLPFGMHNRSLSGGTNPMASVSPGMLQSFMQRNPDPSNSGL